MSCIIRERRSAACRTEDTKFRASEDGARFSYAQGASEANGNVGKRERTVKGAAAAPRARRTDRAASRLALSATHAHHARHSRRRSLGARRRGLCSVVRAVAWSRPSRDSPLRAPTAPPLARPVAGPSPHSTPAPSAGSRQRDEEQPSRSGPSAQPSTRPPPQGCRATCNPSARPVNASRDADGRCRRRSCHVDRTAALVVAAALTSTGQLLLLRRTAPLRARCRWSLARRRARRAGPGR
jgi:hypothetical protein